MQETEDKVTLIKLQEIFCSFDQYLVFETTFKKMLMANISYRKEPIDLFINEEKTIRMNVGKFFVNLLLMRPFAEFNIMPNESDIIDWETVTQDDLDAYFNHVVQRFRSEEINADYNKIRESITNAMNEMCDISGESNPRIGNSVSYRDLIRLEVEDPEFDKLTHTKVKPGQFNDIETQFNTLGKKLIKYFEDNKNTELHPFVASETGINKKQFTQAIGFVGLKPSMTGDVIPVTINDNFLRGLSGLESYFINSAGTRKALCTNQRYTRKSGLNIFLSGRYKLL